MIFWCMTMVESGPACGATGTQDEGMTLALHSPGLAMVRSLRGLSLRAKALLRFDTGYHLQMLAIDQHLALLRHRGCS